MYGMLHVLHSYFAQITAQQKREENKRHSHLSQSLSANKSKQNTPVGEMTRAVITLFVTIG